MGWDVLKEVVRIRIVIVKRKERRHILKICRRVLRGGRVLYMTLTSLVRPMRSAARRRPSSVQILASTVMACARPRRVPGRRPLV